MRQRRLCNLIVTTAILATATPALAAPNTKSTKTQKVAALAPLPPAPPAQEANPLPSEYFVKRAQVALDAVDTGQAGSVWDGASAQMHAAITRPAFEAVSDARRRKFGVITTRDWNRIERLVMAPTAATATTPAQAGGVFVSVSFNAKTRDGKDVRELASFVLGTDGQWRLAGVVGN